MARIFPTFTRFSRRSNYSLAGFRLGGGVNNTDANNSLPQVLAGQTNQLSKADSTTYSFNLSRDLAVNRQHVDEFFQEHHGLQCSGNKRYRDD